MRYGRGRAGMAVVSDYPAGSVVSVSVSVSVVLSVRCWVLRMLCNIVDGCGRRGIAGEAWVGVLDSTSALYHW